MDIDPTPYKHAHHKVCLSVPSWRLPMHSSAPVLSSSNHFSTKMPNVCAIPLNWTKFHCNLKVFISFIIIQIDFNDIFQDLEGYLIWSH